MAAGELHRRDDIATHAARTRPLDSGKVMPIEPELADEWRGFFIPP